MSEMMGSVVHPVPEGPRLPTIAYFSMEIGLEPGLPTYSGGLGMLAGDTLRAAADIGLPMVGVTLLYRKGYFRQSLDGSGNQAESPEEWNPEHLVEAVPARVSVPVEGRPVRLRAWRYTVNGALGHRVPVYLLDSDLEENDPWDRTLTDHLYGGDERYRLAQEILLGIGGVTMLRILGHREFTAYHMNEGHSSLLGLALLDEVLGSRGDGAITAGAIREVRDRCVFTTHTPVPAGHDAFPMQMARGMLGERMSRYIEQASCCLDGVLNMTFLALFFSRYVNGVSMRHEDVSQDMFPTYPINAITNGVHVATWAAPPLRELFDRHVPEWRRDPHYLRYAVGIPVQEIRDAHAASKASLLREVEARTGRKLHSNVLTIGFARRATPYKRAGLIFSDLARLTRIARDAGPMQIVYAGRAHPRDWAGKDLIRSVYQFARELEEQIQVVYLENYDMALGRLLCSGVDLWLNTPEKPREASGTSGMKAALNGVPSLSVLDGWWIEGHVEDVTGWAIGESWRRESITSEEVAALYDKLEWKILPLYYQRPDGFARVRRSAIAINGSFFNAQRMLIQYLQNAYRPDVPKGRA